MCPWPVLPLAAVIRQPHSPWPTIYRYFETVSMKIAQSMCMLRGSVSLATLCKFWWSFKQIFKQIWQVDLGTLQSTQGKEAATPAKKRHGNMRSTLKGVSGLLCVSWCRRQSWHLQMQVIKLLFSFLGPVCKAILSPSRTEADTGHGQVTALAFLWWPSAYSVSLRLPPPSKL